MKRSRRLLALCVIAAVCLLQDSKTTWAEGDKPPKLSREEKAYIKRMIEHGREEKQYPDRNWMLQGCRLNMHGTWYPFTPFGNEWLGRMVITGDSIIFEKLGEFPYEILRSEYGPEIPPYGALPRRERHLYKLDRSVYLGAYWRKENNVYVVIAHPPWSKHRNDPINWIFRCVPDFALCNTLEKAWEFFENRDGTGNHSCNTFTFMPYDDD
ncbi:MAG: hypothetical protein HQL44_03770 [Alphaproteobacteria bacterium]|nr:hypothetical protein [Alphaproteobacteria bacterium]